MSDHFNYRKVLDKGVTIEDLKKAKTAFWGKMHKFIGKIPFARQATALYYLVLDPKVNLGLKSTAVLALLYFISPIDMVPDIIPITGLMDDATVITAAVTILGTLIAPYLEKADDWYERGAPLKDDSEVVKDIEVSQV